MEMFIFWFFFIMLLWLSRHPVLLAIFLLVVFLVMLQDGAFN